MQAMQQGEDEMTSLVRTPISQTKVNLIILIIGKYK